MLLIKFVVALRKFALITVIETCSECLTTLVEIALSALELVELRLFFEMGVRNWNGRFFDGPEILF